MYNTNDWCWISNALNESECGKVQSLAENKWKRSVVRTNLTGPTILGVNDDIRRSDIVWTANEWLQSKIWPLMVAANEQSGWKYDIEQIEGMQITRYRKGEYYNFHRDGRGDNLAANGGFVRKLSMTVLLNDGYEGGDFQFAQINNGKIKIDTPDFNGKQGSMVMFPSDMDHRITPVTKGTRYSLVVWFLGPPFK